MRRDGMANGKPLESWEVLKGRKIKKMKKKIFF